MSGRYKINKFQAFSDTFGDKILTGLNSRLYLYLILRYDDEKGFAYPSYSDLSKNVTVNRTNLSNSISALKDKGYIEVKQGWRNANNYYLLKHITSNQTDTSNQTVTQPVTKQLLEVVTKQLPNSINNSINNNIYSANDIAPDTVDSEKYVDEINKKIIDDLLEKIKKSYDNKLVLSEFKNLKDSGLDNLTLLKEIDKRLKSKNKTKDKSKTKDLKVIEELWKLYPRKKGKADSLKSIDKILKTVSKDELIRSIERYSKEVKGKEEQFILIGSTFFNGRYVDYLDCNYQEENKKQELKKLSKEELEAKMNAIF